MDNFVIGILAKLRKSGDMGVSAGSLGSQCGSNEQTVIPILRDLNQQGIVTSRWQQTGTGGSQSLFWTLAPEFLKVLDKMVAFKIKGTDLDNILNLEVAPKE